MTVTWQRQSFESTQFALKLITQDGQTDSSHDLTVPDGQLSGTEIFLPSVVGYVCLYTFGILLNCEIPPILQAEQNRGL